MFSRLKMQPLAVLRSVMVEAVRVPSLLNAYHKSALECITLYLAMVTFICSRLNKAQQALKTILKLVDPSH